MSMLKKNALAVALVAGLGLAGAAGAYTTWTNGDTDPEMIATADAADGLVVMTETVQINVEDQDLIVGRTTGFQVRLNLNGGVTYDQTFDPNSIQEGPDLPDDWTVSLAAGGANSSYLVINVAPPETNADGIVPGNIINVAGIPLADVDALEIEGGKVTAQSFFVDPVGASEIDGSRVNLTLVQAGNPVVLECDATDGNVAKRIDVADLSDVGGPAAKTQFSPDGVLGDPEDGWFNFGSLSASVEANFSTFVYEAGDEFTTVLTGDSSSNFNAFDSIYLASDWDCDIDSVLVEGDIDGNTVTFDYTLDDVNGNEDGFEAYVCGEVDGETVIDDVNPITSVTTFSRPETQLTASSGTCSLLPLQYNGSVVEIFHINPAGNATAQSYLRVINRSSTSGRVHILGIDDEGHEGISEVSFMLGAGESMQLNSEDLEKGNPDKGITGSWGDGHGKWRAILTAEFGGARVQAMNRNSTNGTVTNLTEADGQGEQTIHELLDNIGGIFIPN